MQRSQRSLLNISNYVIVSGRARCSHMFVHPLFTLAKEKRRLYTLGSIEDVSDAPPNASGAPVPPSCPLQPSSTTSGADRGPRSTKTARMRTGPLPPHLKERVIAAMAKARPPKAATAPVDPSAIESINVETLSITTPEVDVPQVQMYGPGVVDIVHFAPETAPVHNDYTSTPTDFFDADYVDVDMSDMDLATDPWEVMEHPTGDIIIDGDSSLSSSAAGQMSMDVGILPRLGTLTLIETEPPTLLFKDEDVRPDWLMSAVKEFLRYTPYYGGLGQLIDLFLRQEARLGYPNLVLLLSFFSH